MRGLGRLLTVVCIMFLLFLPTLSVLTNTQAAATKTPLPTKTLPPTKTPKAPATSEAASAVGTLAFLVYENASTAVYLVDTDGKNFRRLDTLAYRSADDVIWSPDGKHLAYRSEQGLAITDADGSNPKFSQKAYNPLYTWAPDSQSITVVLGSQIVNVNPVTGESHPLFTLKLADGDSIRVAGLRWAPDGKHLLYIVAAGNNHKAQLHVFDVASSTEQLIVTTVQPSTAAWSPDSQKIMYFGVDGQKGGIFITDPGGKATSAVFPNYTAVFYGDWSPDSKQLAYISARSELSVIGINGRNPHKVPLPADFKFEITAVSWRPAVTTPAAATAAVTTVSTAVATKSG